MSAFVFIVVTYWFALGKLIDHEERLCNVPARNLTLFILFILSLQLIYGAFMAGMKAATVAPTWPSINGDYFPSSLLSQSFFNHPINIHFIHRMLAYLIFGLLIFWFWKVRSIKGSAILARYRIFPLIFVIIQILLGVLAVLLSTHIARNSFGPF